MKISLISETFPPEVNGVARTLYNLVNGLKAKGHEIQVFRPKLKPFNLQESALDIEQFMLHSLPLPGYSELRMGLPNLNRIYRNWKKNPPDVAYIATEGPLGYAALLAAKKLGVPAVSGFHTHFQSYMEHYNLGALKDSAELYLKDFHNRTLATFVPTEDTRDQLLDIGFKNLKIMGRGVDTHLFSPSKRDMELRKSWGAGPLDPVCLYVGRVASEKNMDLFFRSVDELRKEHPKVTGVVVGDGPSRKAYEAGHRNFVFTGMKKGEELAAHYASADYFVFPSMTETFGNVVTEALASGLAIVAFNYAAPRLYINSGDNGFLAPMGDRDAFVHQARRALSMKAEIETVKVAARVTAEGISWENVVDRLDHDICYLVQRFERRQQLKRKFIAKRFFIPVFNW